MDEVFIKVLNMSVSASWLVLVVLALRFLLKKSPRWIHVALWALVALRLICPWSPESKVSLVPEKATEHMVENLSGSYYGDAMIYSQGSEEYNAAVAAGVTPSVGDNDYHYVLTQPDDPTKPVSTAADFYGQVWIVGMMLMLFWAWLSYFRLKRKVSASIDIGNGVYICDYIDTPFILGVAKPKIYLPSSMDPAAAAHVLAHERAHITRKDHWWKPFGYLLLTAHWFNPLMWLAYALLCRDIELACDEKVVREMALPERKSYSDALLQCSVSRRHIAACPLAFGEVGVKERVKTVLHYKKPALWIVMVAILALIITAVCFLTDPKNEEPEITEPTADSTEAIGGTPYEWTSSVAVWDIRKAWIHAYGDASYPNTLEGDSLGELLSILNSVTDEQIVFRKPVGEDDPHWNMDNYTSVYFTYAEGAENLWVWLRYADDTVMIGTEFSSDIWKTGEYGYWTIENESLTLWMEKIADGGTWMLSDENRDEIRRLVRQEYVQFFAPTEYDGLLFVGCAWDNGRGLGVALFEETADGYDLLAVLRDENVKRCASGEDLYYCDFNNRRIFLVMNDSVTGMEFSGAYEAAYAVDVHPGLLVTYFPPYMASMYRFVYRNGISSTMYMDWNNQPHGGVPDYSVEAFDTPDNAFSVCSRLKPEEVYVMYASEIVEVDERYEQSYAKLLTYEQKCRLLEMLNALPESAYQETDYPSACFRSVDISFLDFTPDVGGVPYLKLGLREGAVYYQFSYDAAQPYQTWKIDDAELYEYVESFFDGDISTWHRFAPIPKMDGMLSFEVNGVEIVVGNMTALDYEFTDRGLRFKPRGEDGWVELLYRSEPLAVCGTGLKTVTGTIWNYSCVTGYYDEQEYWSFRDITMSENGHIVLLNEGDWVAEYDDEISWILQYLRISE